KGGNRLGLNGGRMGVTRVPKGADERFGNAEIRESLFSHLKGLLSSQRLAPTTMAGALTRGLAAFQRAWNREGSELFRDQAVPRQREARTREQSPFKWAFSCGMSRKKPERVEGCPARIVAVDCEGHH